MSNIYHYQSLGDNNHPITANPNSAGSSYATIAARDADVDFHGEVENLNKVVRVESPLSFYILTSNVPAWLELTKDFGQELGITDSPQFVNLTLTGDLIVQGTTTTLDTVTLLVEDKNIELGSVAVPTDVTADGGGITLKGATDKTIKWLDATNAWTFDQDIDALANIIKTTGIISAGTLLATGPLLASNLKLDGNTLSSTNANGDITLDPNGTGKVQVVGLATQSVALEVLGAPGASVGGFPSGSLQVRSPGTGANDNAVITGHNSFGGNTQLWYFGSVSSSNSNIALINRRAGGEVHIHAGNTKYMTVEATGNVIFEQQIRIKGGVPGLDKVLTSDANGLGTWQTPPGGGSTIYAQLNSSVNQEPTDTNPTVITYNTQDAISGLTHSTTVNPGEITIDTAGIYFVSPQPQVGKTSGGTKIDFDMFLQVDRGSGFADEANSNIKLSIKDSDITDVIVSAFTIQLDAGDKIRMMQRVSSSTVGMGLKNTAAEVGPPTIPRTPSIIFTMYRVGGI